MPNNADDWLNTELQEITNEHMEWFWNTVRARTDAVRTGLTGRGAAGGDRPEGE